MLFTDAELEGAVWVGMLEPYIDSTLHQKGDLVPIYKTEDAEFLVTNGIAELVDVEATQKLEGSFDIKDFEIEPSDVVWTIDNGDASAVLFEMPKSWETRKY